MARNDRAGDAGREGQQGSGPRRRAERRPEMVKRRREQRRQEMERQRRNWLLIRVISGVVIVAILAGVGWWGFRQWEEFQVSQDVEEYFGVEDYAANHVEGEVLYEQIPPVGGPHNSIWQNCGFYTEPIYNWHGVHSLEHGAVWITYDPDLPQEDVDKLRDLANQSYVLVSPYPGLEHPVVASVWGKQLVLDGADDDRLEPFIREYRMNPNNTPEPGALCSLGVDYTMEEGETPQLEPAFTSGTPDQVAAAEATATVEAGGTVPEEVEAGTPSAGASPPAIPVGSPVATPTGTPVATPE
jgi:hypothetical protein